MKKKSILFFIVGALLLLIVTPAVVWFYESAWYIPIAIGGFAIELIGLRMENKI